MIATSYASNGGAKSSPTKSYRLVYGQPPYSGSWPEKASSHYLDTLGSQQCSRNLEGIIRTCHYTGTPSKCEGVLTFLGMELDSINMEIRIQTSTPPIRMGWPQVWRATVPHRARLQGSTPGPLVPPKTLHSGQTSRPLHPSRRSSQVRRTVVVALCLPLERYIPTDTLRQSQPPTLSHGRRVRKVGLRCLRRKLQFEWPTTSHISIREMIPVVMSAALWGRDWSGKSVLGQVVALINAVPLTTPLSLAMLDITGPEAICKWRIAER